MLCLKHQIIASECEEYFASTFSNAVFDDCSNLLGDVYSKDVEMTENIRSEQQYNELLKAYTKEALASMIKADIRTRFPEPYASMYCQQFDNFKTSADFFEFAAKLMRR